MRLNAGCEMKRALGATCSLPKLFRLSELGTASERRARSRSPPAPGASLHRSSDAAEQDSLDHSNRQLSQLLG
jgi:hypothetical protein